MAIHSNSAYNPGTRPGSPLRDYKSNRLKQLSAHSHMVVLFPVFENLMRSPSGSSIYIPHQSVQDSSSLQTLSLFIVCRFFDYVTFCKAWWGDTCCGFDLHSHPRLLSPDSCVPYNYHKAPLLM